MKLFTTLLVFLLSVAALSCTDEAVDNADHADCVRAKFIANYCVSDKPLHLIQFLEPTDLATAQKSQTSDSTFYLAAVLDLPDSVQKIGAVFYMKFHFDQDAENKYRPKICQAVFSPVKILVCDSVSSQFCQ
ncbi:MAG: hypothetical protein ABIN80_06240 [Dyadobacter sp.]|uniref:hypothetical protein n=1 Tax=Dyadobacter sp. TaxID=1914288 RepID=UPI003264108A